MITYMIIRIKYDQLYDDNIRYIIMTRGGLSGTHTGLILIGLRFEFRGQRFQPYLDISKFWFEFDSDLCGFGSGLDNPFKLF